MKSAFAVLAILPVAPMSAQGNEFCVSCEGPEAHYACTITGGPDESSDGSLKLYCITELAKIGQHASCSVDRTQGKPCAGSAKILAMPQGYQPLPAPPPAVPSEFKKANPEPAPPVTGPATAADEGAAAKPDAPPKTVQEMVEKGTSNAGKALEKGGDTVVDAAKSTGSAFSKAGKAVGNAAKKTWTCLTSLFGDC